MSRKEADKRRFYVTEKLVVGTYVWAFNAEEAEDLVRSYSADSFDVLETNEIFRVIEVTDEHPFEED